MTKTLYLLAIVAALALLGSVTLAKGKKKMNTKQLSEAEKQVILKKGTEAPFSGQFVDHKGNGTYTCKQCGEPLFQSGTKFDSGSGWPSFDDAIDGAVREVPDADGMRTEIVCAKCGGHLGHVFRGEGYTANNTRHCVNSISLDFVAGSSSNTETAYFAGGCFWGVEYLLEKEPGVIDAVSGYMGGHVTKPTYQQVSYTDTGHAETVKVVFDPRKTSFQKLATLFFEIHDPTQENRQGPDVGSQYRSAVFYVGDQQKKATLELIKTLKKKGFKVVTEVRPADTFWPAEEYHQDYYSGNGKEPYCHSRVERF